MEDRQRRAATATAVWAGLGASVLAVAALGLAVALAPARSGPYCLAECVEYPYTAVAQYVPVEYWWMLPAAALPLALVVMLVGLRHAVAPARGVLSDVVVLLASGGALTLLMAYSIQLMVVVPSLVGGEEAALALWSMYNPHGLFIALENLGYFLSSAALAGAGWLVAGVTRWARATRWWAWVGGAAGVVALPVLAAAWGDRLEYRYEVAVIVFFWAAMIGWGPLLAVAARRERTAGSRSTRRSPAGTGTAQRFSG